MDLLDLTSITDNLSLFPGNSQGSVPYPSFPDSTQSIRVGEGSNQSSWTKFFDKVTSVVTFPFRTAESAYDVVANAPANIANFVSGAEQRAVSAATGISSTIKWVVVGILAIAAVYIMSILAPGIIAGRK